MTKSITYGWVVLIAITVVAGFYACQKDRNMQVTIIGNWANTFRYAKAQLYTQTYTFNADSTMLFSSAVVDSASGNVLGYEYRSNGKFRLNGDQLKLYQLAIYENLSQTAMYSPLTQLTLIKADTVQTITINISSDGNTFHFVFPPCGPSANCIGEIDYKRK